MSLRIATYNFLHGGSPRRSGHMSRMLDVAYPDVLLCQEAPDAVPPSGAKYIWRAVPGYRWGSGILVRGFRARALHVEGFEGWVIGAELKLNRRTTRIFSIHCPAGARGYVRTMHEVLDGIRPFAHDADIVLGGDFNVAAGYRGADDVVRMSRGERELLDRIANELGLIACWQTLHPGVPLAQTLRWSANRVAPYHCDGIFVPRKWLKKLETCDVLTDAEWTRLSDHNPVVMQRQLTRAARATSTALP